MSITKTSTIHLKYADDSGEAHIVPLKESKEDLDRDTVESAMDAAIDGRCYAFGAAEKLGAEIKIVTTETKTIF